MLLVIVAVIFLLLAAIFQRLGSQLIARSHPPRLQTLLSGLVCLAAGSLFLLALVRDWSDDIYYATALTGTFLIVDATAFALASIAPNANLRLFLTRTAVTGTVIAAVLGLLMLTLGLLSLDQYVDPQRTNLQETHVIGLVVLIPSALLILLSYLLIPRLLRVAK
jgi:hypothetical protein